MANQTRILLSIIESINAGNYDEAHDDAALLDNVKLQRDIQTNLQCGRPSTALYVADTAIGR